MSDKVSDTPRTDALAKDERHLTRAESEYWSAQYKYLARQLERELNAANARVKELEATSKVCTGCGHENVPVSPDFVACCPDNRYRTAKELLGELDIAKYRVMELEAMCCHYHVKDNEFNDSCRECGLYLRDSIHLRHDEGGRAGRIRSLRAMSEV